MEKKTDPIPTAFFAKECKDSVPLSDEGETIQEI